MRTAIFGLTVALGVATGGCTMTDAGGTARGAAAPGGSATVTLIDASGASKGTATLRQSTGGVQLSVMAMGMTPGPKGIHFHTTGRCDSPDFTTAGGHWNPSTMKHGKDSGAGPHQGDLPNITIGADGTGRMKTMVRDAMLTGGATPMLDTDGTALIIHAAADDYRTDPSGNSGARLACGVVTPA